MAASKNATAPNTERRSLKVDKAIIRTLIRGQAGSLEKALMEAVANSMDAGANQVDVSVTAQQVVIKDNGKGFSKREDIEKYFEVFGFEHEGLGRDHGRFGVGRGQLFSYGVNRWRTHTFEMTLDVDNAGLDYDFQEGLKATQGMSITIDLYKELSLGDHYALEENFRNLVRYSVMPVFYNGKQINENPLTVKWNLETEDAWFNLKREGDLRIYSQGLLVAKSYGHGVGGVLVTKPGHPFELNMARNDILKDKCQVWGRVKKVLSTKARELGDKGMRQNTLTDDQRSTLALNTLVEGKVEDLWERPLFTLTNGKHVSLRNLTNRSDWVEAAAGDRKADVLIQRQTLFALSPETMTRFGVESLDELKERLMEALQRHERNDAERYTAAFYRRKLEGITTHADLTLFEALVNLDFELVKPSELNADEKAVMVAVRKMGYHMARLMTEARKEALGEDHPEAEVSMRTIQVMRSDTANGMTDGRKFIWLNRDQLPRAHYGVPGFFQLATLLAHEYSHLSSSQGSHQHDHAFYELYHDLTRSDGITRMAINGFGYYLRHAEKASAKLQSHMDMVFKGDVGLLFKGDGEAALAAQEAAFTEELLKVYPPRPANGRKGTFIPVEVAPAATPSAETPSETPVTVAPVRRRRRVT